MSTTILVLVIYLVIMFFVAWYFSRKESVEAYFVNKRKTNVWLMTFSTVATVVGAGATVAIVSEVYNTGISYGIALPISFIVGMFILGLAAKKIKTIGDEYGARTIVDFFEKRFDKKNRNLTGILQLFLLTIWIGVQAIAISSLASVLIGIDYNVAIFVAAAITILYTAIGGLKVDIITDFIQFWIIAIVFIVMAIVGYQHVGSFGNLFSQLPVGHLDVFAFGGVSWFVGVLLVSGFLYLGNTIHWQRIFSAENEMTAKKSFFWAIPITAFLGFIVLFLGLISVVLLPQVQKETAIFALMNNILPPWLVGAGFAAILAVIMSSIDSLLVGGSAIIHKALFKDRSIEAKKELFYARVLTGVFGIFGFVLAFLIPNIVTLSLIVTYLALIFVPPIYAALYSKKVSANASFYSILIPSIVLFAMFPFLKENTFVVTVLLGVLIITLYDKVFKNKVVETL
ncbi:MAG: sodium/ solute symporter [Candidatus Yanofskybacteria bacterium GW2011_GWD2_39_48]|uniref:Sodium/ solute symporter n=1 Tax=Candidatus Yanofskybacteria bacterium GW2011_GWD2_39_48 TaxID=1619031 RepID=A0A0G0RMR0_9BACT|nr:MAG: sodium/ solute symporter [Candidatus Yanofskybacteria bacterium GW2011_GWD2_39_48]